MGRKAKDAAQKKISEWTGTSVHRNVSKSETKTTTKNENTSASNENRNPLQSHSQSEINAMKNCTVRLEKIPIESKQMEKNTKTPVKTTPAAAIETKDKPNAAKNIYDDFSFDADEITLETGQEDAMKELFDKLARENKIEVKKYRPKVGKKKKPDPKDPVKKTAIQKRRREKQPTETEPPQKKPNLKTKVTGTVKQKMVAMSANIVTKTNEQNELNKLANNNNSAEKVVVVAEPKKTVATKTAINTEHINAQPRLRNRHLNHISDFQSTPKSSTPLGNKATPTNKENNRSMNSLFFNSASPLVVSRPTRANLQKQRLQLSAIEDSQEEASTSTAHKDADNNAAPQYHFTDADFDFDDDLDAEPAVVSEMDKENSLDRPSTSANGRSSPQTSTAVSNITTQRRPETSAIASTSYDQPSTSSAANTPLRNANNQSVFDIQNTSDYHIFSPTKRRVYGRSPLKNITSEVNNTNSPSFESAKSIPVTMPRSFGSLAKSTLNSIQTDNLSKELDITLPEASYFSSRRAADDFDRSINNQNFVDDCFGFDVADDEDIDINNDTVTEDVGSGKDQAAKEKERQLEMEKSALKEIRARLKRFLHNPESNDVTAKKTKVDSNDRLRKKKVKSPVKNTAKSPAKTVKTPVKRHVVFGEGGAKQKDIRNAFTTKAGDKDKHKKPDDGPVALFEEIDTVQDRRRSYSRPQRQRKRRISIDTDESEEEEPHSDDEEFNADGKPSKRAKRRKKNTAPNPKEQEELNEFLQKTNAHFAEVESFALIIE